MELSPDYAGGFVSVSLCYLVFRSLLQLVVLRVRSHEWKELEIVVLRHELAILRRQTRRPSITALDRLFLAAASRLSASRALPVLHRHTCDPPSLASALGREAVDLRASGWSPANAA
jgi:hypothetical protein